MYSVLLVRSKAFNLLLPVMLNVTDFTAESMSELILNRPLSSVAGTLFVCVHLCKCCSADL